MTRNTVQLVSKHIFSQNFQGLIHHLHISQNEMKIKGYANFFFFFFGRGGANKVCYGRCANGKWVKINTVGQRASFCLKQFEAVLLVKKSS